MAPDARIVSVKVADAMGAADVSQIIAAIDWVVQNTTTGGFNIRVLNLSFGTNTTNPYTIDRCATPSRRPGARASPWSPPPATPASTPAGAAPG
jgi:subtilisin family serine protease